MTDFLVAGAAYKSYLDSETGRNYYVHTASGIATWNDPRPIPVSKTFPLVVIPVLIIVFFIWVRFKEIKKSWPEWATVRLKPKKVKTRGARRARGRRTFSRWNAGWARPLRRQGSSKLSQIRNAFRFASPSD